MQKSEHNNEQHPHAAIKTKLNILAYDLSGKVTRDGLLFFFQKNAVQPN